MGVESTRPTMASIPSRDDSDGHTQQDGRPQAATGVPDQRQANERRKRLSKDSQIVGIEVELHDEEVMRKQQREDRHHRVAK
jgi:hypothetical protein